MKAHTQDDSASIIIDGHDRALRKAHEQKVGGFIAKDTWETMKRTGEARGCACPVCSK